MAFVLRWSLGLLRSHEAIWRGDAGGYLAMGEWLIGKGGYFVSSHPPVFPLFLAFSYVLSGRSDAVALGLQSLVSACVVPLVFTLANRAAGRRAAWWSAAVVMVDPFLVFFASNFYSETIFTTLLVLSFVLLVRAFDHPSSSRALGTGILLALVTLSRGAMLPFLPFIAAWYAWGIHRQGAPALARTAVLFAGLVLPMAAWSVMLHAKTGHWVVAEVKKGRTLYEGLNPQINEGPEANEAWYAAIDAEARQRGLIDPVEIDQYFWRKSLRFYREHPGVALKLSALKFVKFWRLYPYAVYPPWQQALSALYMVPLLFGLIVGVWDQLRRWRSLLWENVLLLGFLILYTLANSIWWNSIRYRVPLHPFLACFAVCGYLHLLRKQPEA